MLPHRNRIGRFFIPVIALLLLGNAPANSNALAEDSPHIVMIIAEPEYETNRTLPAFAADVLAKEFRVSIIHGSKTDQHDLPGLEVLKDADLLLISVRRRMLTAPQMQLIRDHIQAGKPVVGIRTANHAFSLRGKVQPPEGYALWETFDGDVIGGHYTGHHGKDLETSIAKAPGAAEHPILEDVDTAQLVGNGSLYLVSPLAESAKPLLIGTVVEKAPEPVAWTNIGPGGGRVFYTSLGHSKDFENKSFRRLLKNGIVWALGKKADTEGTTKKSGANTPAK